MIIAVPVERFEGIESRVYGHFGSAPAFAVCDTQTGDVKMLGNADKVHVHGQCNPVSDLSVAGVESVVCAGMGVRAYERLNGMNIRVYLAPEAATVKDVLELAASNNLEQMTAEAGCSHHGGHNCR